ncbi:MAG: hypothetical protein M3Y56_16300, partial [Armatimonadota bacterium]|nr:hypothetical protein [Armatimonadota bacterium]
MQSSAAAIPSGSGSRKRKSGVAVLTPVGNMVLSVLSFVGGLVELLGATIGGIFRLLLSTRIGPVERRVAAMDFGETIRQMQVVSWGAFWIAIVTVTSSGMVVAMETVQQLTNFGLAQAYL